MDELQARLARLGLNVLAEYGFALAGGYALQAHHLVERMNEDINMFTDRWDPNSFAAADAVSGAFRDSGQPESLGATEPQWGRRPSTPEQPAPGGPAGPPIAKSFS